MKKNPGRKMRRQQQRNEMAELKKEASKVYVENEFPTEPHPNAIKANEIREQRTNSITDKFEQFKNVFSKTTKLGAEMIKEQKARLKRREQWKKERGLV